MRYFKVIGQWAGLAQNGPEHTISFPISFTDVNTYRVAAAGCGNGTGNGSYINMNLYSVNIYKDRLNIATMTIGFIGEYAAKPTYGTNLRCQLIAIGY